MTPTPPGVTDPADAMRDAVAKRFHNADDLAIIRDLIEDARKRGYPNWHLRLETACTAIEMSLETHASALDDERAARGLAEAERNDAQARIADLEAKLAQALKALAPFAAVADYDVGENEDDADIFRPASRYNVAPVITVGDLRRAASASAKPAVSPKDNRHD